MKNMTTVFEKNRFKLLTNGTSVSLESYSTTAATSTATTTTNNNHSSGDILQHNSTSTTAASGGILDGGAATGFPGAVAVKQEPEELVDNKCTVIISQIGSQDTNGPGTSECEEDSSKKLSEVDIAINNVVCSFSVGCHLNLRQIALKGVNVEYRRESNMITMKLRKPSVTASVWSSGKITCTGAQSEIDARKGARRIARIIQKLGFDTRFRRMRIVNVLGSCSMPFEIRINAFSQHHREAEYEPELHPGVTYKVKPLKATLKIFSTGSITVTAPSVPNVQQAIEHIFPLVSPFRKEFTNREEMLRRKTLALQKRNKRPRSPSCSSNDEDNKDNITKIKYE